MTVRVRRAACGLLTVALLFALVSACGARPTEPGAHVPDLAAPPTPTPQPVVVAQKPRGQSVRAVRAPSGVRLTISTPAYDAPGATVPAIATISGQSRPGKVRFTMRGSHGSAAACSGTTWRNPHDGTISQTCYLTLPRKRTAVWVSARAVVTRGSHRYQVGGTASRPVYARGPVSRTLSLAQIHDAERCGNRSEKVWLTFDDGTTPALLTSILRTLRRARVRAIFLWTGTFARSYPKLVSRVVRAGHWLGNHSDTHVPMSDRSSRVVRREIRRGVDATTTPRVMRPPFAAGAFSQRVRRLAGEQGYTVCRWTADSADWSELSSASQIVRRVRFGDRLSPPLQRSGVLLLHSTVSSTAAALPRIIDAVRQKGYALPRLPEGR